MFFACTSPPVGRGDVDSVPACRYRNLEEWPHRSCLTERSVLAVQVYHKSIKLRWTFTAEDRLGIRRRQPGQQRWAAYRLPSTRKERGVKVEGKQPSAQRFAFPLRTSRSRTGNTAQKDVPLYWHPRRALLDETQRKVYGKQSAE